MLPLAAALLLRQATIPVLPPAAPPLTVPSEVRDWAGFKYLPAGARATPKAFPGGGDWSDVKGTVAAGASVWRTKVVILDRVERAHERGPTFVWPGHHGLAPQGVAQIRRALPQLRARVADLTSGAVNMVIDVSEEPEPLPIEGGDLANVVARYLAPRINDGRYESEDGVFRGPYQSVFVIHPVGGEAKPLFEVGGTPVSLLGIPDVEGQEADGALANEMTLLWQGQAARRAADAGATVDAAAPALPPDAWPTILQGRDAMTEGRLRVLGLKVSPGDDHVTGGGSNERGPETAAKIVKDPTRGSVLTVEETGYFRQGGLALPTVAGSPIDVATTPTFAFWAKSDARDPIVLQFEPGQPAGKVVELGKDVPFAYDNAWHRVKIDLRPLRKVSTILVAPDAVERASLKQTLGPVVASFSDLEITTEAPDAAPAPEPPSPTAASPEARAVWAASAPPGDERRTLMKDPSEAVRANAVAAALVKPDPNDEPLLIESALYTFEPTVFTPAMRALGKARTPTAQEALGRAIHSAASERARGLAAEILAETGDAKLVPEILGLNQAKSRAARISAIRALGRLPGEQASMMRMAFLPQEDAEIKMEATLTADANDDYQGRKLLWSAVNEPSDAVRLESLRRLAASNVKEFQAEGLKGVRDDSVGVRVGLLQAWTVAPKPEYGPSIHLALTDRAPRVRAAALDALAAGAEKIQLKDLPLDDPDPRVQIALLRLVRAKALALPADVRERLRKSPDPQVRAALGA